MLKTIITGTLDHNALIHYPCDGGEKFISFCLRAVLFPGAPEVLVYVSAFGEAAIQIANQEVKAGDEISLAGELVANIPCVYGGVDLDAVLMLTVRDRSMFAVKIVKD